MGADNTVISGVEFDNVVLDTSGADHGPKLHRHNARPADHGPRVTGKGHFLIYRAKNKPEKKSVRRRNRRNRVTLANYPFYYIGLEVTDYRYTNGVVTRVCVTLRGRKCVKGVAENFF